jgi:heptose I phosphotransferase
VSKLYLRKELEAVWGEHDAFSSVSELTGEIYRAVKNRRTLRVEVNSRIYFAKIHGAVGWAEILKNLITLRWPVVGATNEYVASRALKDAGVRVPEVAAFGIQGVSPASRESFILTDAVEPSISLEDYSVGWLHEKPLRLVKNDLIDQVASMTRQLHAAGLNHRDLYICHFLLDGICLHEGRFELTLIDLHRAQKRSQVPRRWLVKDLGSLLFSSMGLGLQQRDWLRFIKVYSGAPLRRCLAGEKKIFWRDVERRAQSLRKESLQ